MFDVFLSHSSKDKAVVRGLAERLKEDGVRVWFDEWAILPGDPIPVKVEEGLEGSRLLVLCMSANAFGSDWAQLEAGTFRFRDPLNKGRRFLPLRLDDTPVKGSLAQFLYLDWRSEGTYEKLLAICLGDKPKSSAAARSEYLERLIREMEEKARKYSPLGGVGEKRKGAVWTDDPSLALLRFVGRTHSPGEAREYSDVLDAFAAVRKVALLGAPGSGKSTTLRRLALELAKRAQADGGAPAPLYAPLGDWKGDESLAAFLAEAGKGAEGPLVYLLDGLNEAPTAKRAAKAKEVRAFVAGNRTVYVSCRKEDYVGELDLGVDTLTLEPLTPRRIRAAVTKWMANLGEPEALAEQFFWELAGDAGLAQEFARWEGEEAAFWAGDVERWEFPLCRAHLRSSRNLMKLAANPFLLTMLFEVWKVNRELPKNRGDLFHWFIHCLLTREGLVADAENDAWRLLPDGERLLTGLTELAWRMQRERAGDDFGVLTVTPRKAAVQCLGGEALVKKALDGTILEGGEELRFRHQLLQEYFTAKALQGKRLQAAELWPAAKWWERTGWEETAVLLAGLYSDDCTPVVRWVAEAQPEVAAQCLLESGAGVRDREGLLGELGRLWRPRLLGEGTPEGRAAVGRALGRLGLDDRRGVGLRKDGVPDIDWVRIPGGEFVYQEGERRKEETFYMARYPVTNLQYQAFLDDPKGYAADRWWVGMTNPERTAAKGEWEERNSPRETVNWWEAMAYCAWLSEKLGYRVTLPTEWQWERAARGTDGREYPWGNGYISGSANIDETWGEKGPHNLGRTSAVGIYPTGRSPEGVMDLSGNVWEWCVNEYKKPKRTQAGETEPRVLRGGGWYYNTDNARAAFRFNYPPGVRDSDLGFRPVCSSPIR